MAPRKRKFETIEEVEAAYATPNEYESRDEARKRKQRRRQAIARFRRHSIRETSVAAPASVVLEPSELGESTSGIIPTATINESSTSPVTNPSAQAQRRAYLRSVMTPSQREAQRTRNREQMRLRRAALTNSQRERVRERDRVRQAARRLSVVSEELRQQVRERNTQARSNLRAQLRDEVRQSAREANTALQQRIRADMTEEQRHFQREQERLRRHSKQYGKAFAYHENFDPAVVEGRDIINGRHYVPRAKKPNCNEDNECPYCGAWKFKTESKGSCCMAGAVRLPQRRGPPMPLARLFNDSEFLRMARVYNNVFAFTSMGATPSKKLEFDDSVAGSRGVYTFRVMGSLCHRLGSLLPPPDKPPMFAQIYMNDPDIATRVGHRSRMTDGLDPAILTELEIMMQEHNPYAQQFLNAREIVLQRQREARERAQAARQLRREQEGKQEEDMHPPPVEPEEDMVLRLHVREGDNPGTHNQPTASEVAAVIIDANAAEPRDIVLYTRQEGFRRIYETSEHYDPLQYPLLHPYGERGWSYTVKYADGRVRHNKTTMSLREFVAYLLYDRDGQNSTILLGGRLSQQYCVDQWAKGQGGTRAASVH